jgi:4a-hydroxytetrahydrobiopterin dehydratase
MVSLADAKPAFPAAVVFLHSKGKELKEIHQSTGRSRGSGMIVDEHHHRPQSYKLPDFKSALAFVNQSWRAIAEEQRHHPDISARAGAKLEITTWTHAVDALTESDFILAAKIDQLN